MKKLLSLAVLLPLVCFSSAFASGDDNNEGQDISSTENEVVEIEASFLAADEEDSSSDEVALEECVSNYPGPKRLNPKNTC